MLKHIVIFSFLLLCMSALISATAYASDVDVTKYRSYNGSFNNPNYPLWGTNGISVLRKLPITFDDGYSIPTGGIPSRLVSPRLISNVLFNRKPEYDVAGEPNTNMLFTEWGQFIVHEISFSWDTNIFSTPTDNQCVPYPISIPKGDPVFDSYGNGGQTMGFCRTEMVANTGTPGNPYQVPNFQTAWLDGSGIYGPDNNRAQAVRLWKGGLLKTSKGVDGDYLPVNYDKKTSKTMMFMANGMKVKNTELFAAGDMRANENAILLSLHTLFVREHNRRAKQYTAAGMTDEEAFQQARKMVIAHIQKITYEDYLPNVLGKPLPAYKGYNENVNPGIAEFFSFAAFRFGHDQLSSILPRLDASGKSVPEGAVLLRDAFWDVDSFKPFGASAFLRGAATVTSRPVDAIFEDDVRQFLFGIGAASASDLGARNVHRGRDIGMGFYNDARVAYGLPPCSTFSCVTPDPQAQKLLDELYGNNNFQYFDSYVGGLLEPKLPGAKVGALFAAAITEQFARIRDGDRFFYLKKGVLTAAELAEVKKTTLSEIIQRNGDSKPGTHHGFTPVHPTTSHTTSKSTTKSKAKPGVRDNAAVAGTTTSSEWSTSQIVAVVVPSAIAGILVIVVIALLFALKKKETKADPEMYQNLVEQKSDNYF